MFQLTTRIVYISLLVTVITGCRTISSGSAPLPGGPTATPEPSSPKPAELPATDPTATGQEEQEEQEEDEGITDDRRANADVTFVRASKSSDGTWRFDVTVSHPDTGWEDYADGWDVLLPDGTALKANPDDPFTRLLLHPHETEQPFTRSQSGLKIPAGITMVTVRAHDLVDGWGGQEITIDLTQASGPGFEVEP